MSSSWRVTMAPRERGAFEAPARMRPASASELARRSGSVRGRRKTHDRPSNARAGEARANRRTRQRRRRRPHRPTASCNRRRAQKSTAPPQRCARTLTGAALSASFSVVEPETRRARRGLAEAHALEAIGVVARVFEPERCARARLRASARRTHRAADAAARTGPSRARCSRHGGQPVEAAAARRAA